MKKEVILAVFICCLVLFGCGKKKKAMEESLTEINLKALAKTIMIYANDNHEAYPTPDQWCDLLIKRCEVPKSTFGNEITPEGQCIFALNPNCSSTSSPEVVVLFETNFGWNQFGGKEKLTTINHGGKGCYVLFNDTHVEFVPTESFDKLKWKDQ